MSAVKHDEPTNGTDPATTSDRGRSSRDVTTLELDVEGLTIDLDVARGPGHFEASHEGGRPRRIGPLDLTLRGGEIVGLVGPSGIGKTSLLRTLVGLATLPVRGSMRFDGVTLSLGTRAAKTTFARWRGRDLAWISAHGAASLDPRRNIGAQASELLRWFGLPKPDEPAADGARAALWSALALDAASTLAATPDTLSIGQGHRAALALALLASPRVLLVDEPAAALDDVTAALVWTHLREEAHTHGRIVLVVDHDLERVLTRCDRVWVLAHDAEYTRHEGHDVVRLALDTNTASLRHALARGDTPPSLTPLLRRPSRTPSETQPDDRAVSNTNTNTNTTPRLELRGVEPPHVTPALRERPFELVLRRGEIHALLGPSGIGKTSLLHVCVGLLRFVSGEVWDDGTPRPPFVYGLRVAGAPALAALRRQTQLVWQDSTRALDPRHDVVTALRAPARHVGNTMPTDVAIDAALDEVGLTTALRDRPVGTLSGGERQRIAIQRALLAKPALLVLDEPTAHLDAPRIAWLIARLHAERDAGTAILLATHDRRFARELGAIEHDLGARAAEPIPPWLEDSPMFARVPVHPA